MSNFLPSFLATDPDVYEHFMGRWSARLAPPFLEFAGVKRGDRVLDVGCGTGTISLALAALGTRTVGVDASESYLDGARRLRSHPDLTYEHGDACRLAYSSESFDACVSTLAIDVIPQVELVAAEMRRVTRPGGVVACATFDFWGGNSVLDLVLDTGAVLDEGIRTLRAQIKARPIVVGERTGQPLGSGWARRGHGGADRAQLRLQRLRGLLVQLLDRSDKGCSAADDSAVRPAERDRAACARRISGWPAGWASIVCRHRPSGARDSSGVNAPNAFAWLNAAKRHHAQASHPRPGKK